MSAAAVEHRVLKGRTPGPRLLILAGVHGDEYTPMEAVRTLANRLVALPFSGAATLVPVANPGAFAAATRGGQDGLDMARVFPGRPDGAPTEQAAHTVSELIRCADALVDLHSGGRTMRVLPMSGYMLHADPDVLERQRRMSRAFGLPVIWGTDASLPGRSLSEARDRGVPAIYVEYGGGEECDPVGVEACVAGCLGVMRELHMIDAATAAAHGAAVLPDDVLVVEDPGPGAGHMQSGHPAPVAGFFRPVVRVGAAVHAGDPLGVVVDAFGDRCTVVRATGAGTVLVLRTVSSVREGDALAVIVGPARDGRSSQ